VLAGVLVATALFCPPVGAEAGSLAKARAQAELLSGKIVAEGKFVHLLTVRYQQDAAQVGMLSLEVAGSLQDARSVRSKLVRTEYLLRQEALVSYTSSAPMIPLIFSTSAELTDKIEYLQVAVGDVQTTNQRYSLEQSSLAQALSTLRRSLYRASRARKAAEKARLLVLAQAASLQAKLARVRRSIALLASAQRAPTGPPVGNGLLKAVTQQLDATSSPSGSARVPPSPSGNSTTTLTSTPPTTTTTVPATTTTTTTPATTTTTTTPTTTTTVPATTTTTTTVPATTTPTTTTTVPATTTTTTSTTSDPTATPSPPPVGAPPPAPAGGVWLELRTCESGDNYQADTGNGYYGAYQFSEATWAQLGYPGRPDLEPYWLQDEAAQRLEALNGWGQWPTCSAALGL